MLRRQLFVECPQCNDILEGRPHPNIPGYAYLPEHRYIRQDIVEGAMCGAPLRDTLCHIIAYQDVDDA